MNDVLYESDRENLTCPHCRVHVHEVWGNLHFADFGETVMFFRCPSCTGLIIAYSKLIELKVTETTGGMVPGPRRIIWPLQDEDSLLPLLNRAAFDRQLALLFRNATASQPLSLLIVDIDRFKDVNDTYGHQKGDSILLGIAEIINNRAKSKGQAFRYGGEEIAILLNDFEEGEAKAFAERIRIDVEQFKFGPENLSITVSVGIATGPRHATDPDSLVARVDEALYNAKGAGRNRSASLL